MHEPDDSLSADRRLWVSVLTQAIEDACSPSTLSGDNRTQVRDEARQWLTKPSQDLEVVCALAAIDMHRFISFAKATVKEADARPRRKKYGGRNRMIAFNGETLSLSEWAARVGICSGSLAKRFKEGWSIEQALTTPARGRGRHQLSTEAQGPAGDQRARSDLNRDFESEAELCQ